MKNYVVFQKYITLINVFQTFCNSSFISHSLLIKISLIALVFVQLSFILVHFEKHQILCFEELIIGEGGVE